MQRHPRAVAARAWELLRAGLLFAAAAAAHAADAPVPPAHATAATTAVVAAQAAPTAHRRQHLATAYRHMHEAAAAGDAATCHAVLQGVADDLRHDWSTVALEMWRDRHACEIAGRWRQQPPSAAEVQAPFDEAVAHFDHAPPDAPDLVPGAAGVLRAVNWSLLRTHGHAALAQALQDAQLQQWLDAAAPPQRQPQAEAALLRHARQLYGARIQADTMHRWLPRLAERLGAGHPVALAMLRAQIFNHRQDGRPAEALAASDGYAELLARHHPDNTLLAMANRSERAGALASLGRLADALDEERRLRDWMQQQQPRPHANLMRSGYRLASLAMAIADHDAAVAYAQSAIDEGQQAPWSDARETHYARVLRELARVLRGDADAGDGLKHALQSLPTADLAITEALAELVRDGAQRGRDDQRRWARERLGQLLAEQAGPLQTARALPLVLDLQLATVGDTAALQSGAVPAAYGLLGRDATLDVLAPFAWARHVAAHHPAGAVWLYKRGAQVLQRLRSDLPEAGQGAQRAWLAAYAADLRHLIGLLIDSGRLVEADQAIELLRSEELAEFQRRSRGAPPRRAPSPPALLSFTPDEAKRNAALAPWVARLQAEATATDARSRSALTWAEQVRATDTDADTALHAAAQALRDQALQPEPADKAPQARFAHTARLPADEARLTYVLRPQGLEVLLQRGQRVQRHLLGTSPAELNRAVQDLRATLVRPVAADAAAVQAAAQHLFQGLIAPLLPQLAGVRHLRIAPDGSLRYLPFAALHDGRRWLVERFALSVEAGPTPAYSTSTSTSTRTGRVPDMQRHRPALAPAAQRSPALRIAALGRTLPDAQHAALPGVQAELAMLAGLRGAAVQHRQDAAFTASALAQAVSHRPDVVHLASHVVLDVAGEEASYLLLGDGQKLSLRALRELPWEGVRLVLLSACDSATTLPTTGAPGSDGAGGGEGRAWSGFAGALHATGVPHVMATLWRIDDAQTAAWMRLFYAPWQAEKKPTKQAAAPGATHGATPGAEQNAKLPGPGAPALNARRLAETQRAWLHRHRGSPWAHPHYWAAFQWLGRPE